MWDFKGVTWLLARATGSPEAEGHGQWGQLLTLLRLPLLPNTPLCASSIRAHARSFWARWWPSGPGREAAQLIAPSQGGNSLAANSRLQQ